MFKNTFIDKSYKIFTDNKNLPNPLTTSKNPIENSLLLIKHFSNWVSAKFYLVACVYYLLNRFLFWKKD